MWDMYAGGVSTVRCNKELAVSTYIYWKAIGGIVHAHGEDSRVRTPNHWKRVVRSGDAL